MKLGIIGAGNMAKAIAFGIVGSGRLLPEEIIVSNPHEGKLSELDRAKIKTTTDNIKVAESAEVIILAVKPHIYPDVLCQISKAEGIGEKLIVSIAPSVSIKTMKSYINAARFGRVMPNTPAMVGEGMSAVCAENEEDEKLLCSLFDAVGKTIVLKEEKLGATVPVGGSSPAMVYMLIESMGDAGVRAGLSREESYKIAAQAVLGAAKMVLETNKHPAELKDNVCSPKGTTIDMVASLEKSGFRSSVEEALWACFEKVEKMSK